jgi:hypothetical protein
MEKEIRESLVSSEGLSALELSRRYCRETVIDELWEMIHEAPLIVFAAAKQIKELALVTASAKKIIHSHLYSQDKKDEVQSSLKYFLGE